MYYEVLENPSLVVPAASATICRYSIRVLVDFIGCDGKISRVGFVQRQEDHFILHPVLVMLSLQIGL